ncbi:MAG: hypothetical protein JOZ82_10420 [Marmoricola sp.]|nr:hypothetical protein [Marmoricola sp.]
MRTDTTWLRLIWVGVGIACVGLVALGVTMTFWTTSSGGDFKYAADYWLTAPALPIGIGMILHAFGLHALQHGRDGRLGTVGVWIFAVCSAVIVVQCMASLFAAAELRWGPSYPLCAFGSFIGVALMAAGSWRVGLLPRWMLGVWPPLVLLGSWFGQSLIPLVLAAFLVATRVVVGRRVDG